MVKKKVLPRDLRRRESKPDTTTSHFGQHLRQARLDRNMTLNDLSSKSETSVTYLSDLERGTLSNPTLDTLRRVAKALDVSLNELLELEPDSGVRSYPSALEEFRTLPQFVRAVEEQAGRMRMSPDELADAWLRMLSSIKLQGKRPKSAMDYYFLFDAISRTL